MKSLKTGNRTLTSAASISNLTCITYHNNIEPNHPNPTDAKKSKNKKYPFTVLESTMRFLKKMRLCHLKKNKTINTKTYVIEDIGNGYFLSSCCLDDDY